MLSVAAIFFLGGTFLSLVLGLGLAIVMIPNWLAGVDILDLFMDNAKALFLAGTVLTIGHGLSFVINFIVMGEFRVAGAAQLIGWPFIRCFALLAAVAVAFVVAAAIPQLATTSGFAAILIVMKLLLDYRLHLAERKSIDRRRQAEK